MTSGFWGAFVKKTRRGEEGAVEGFAALDRNRVEFVVVAAAFLWISWVYVSATYAIAATKGLWMDEALAVSTAKLHSFSEISSAIWNGAEFSPPTYHFFLHLFMDLFGETGALLAPRLPSIVAVYIAALCVYALVRPSTDRLVALAAFAFTLDSGLFPYAVQARPYALIAACLAGSLALWSRMEHRRTTMRAVVLWLLLSVSVSLHFYGFVAPMIIGVMEMLWLVTRREWRWRVWAPLLLALPVLAAWLPLGLHLKAYVLLDAMGSGYYGRPTLDLLLDAVFQSLVSEQSGALLALAVLALCGCACLARRFSRRDIATAEDADRADGSNISPIEIMCVALFATPFLIFLFSLCFSSTFAVRYVSAASLFPALFFGCAVRRAPYRRAIGLALLPLAALGIDMRGADFSPGSMASAQPLLAKMKEAPLPIVVDAGMQYIELMAGSDPDLRSQLNFLLAPHSETRSDPTFENQVKRLAAIHSDFRVHEEQAFLAAVPCFYVLFRPEDTTGATLASLMRQGLLDAPLKAEGGIWLFRGGRGCRG
ncbi:glycosyltransferase family 39 protein [Methylocystis heyeri]|uniref:Uncharacterized protein n=1 Tax=Methylocystis heyeri TaxID=391905 RepID=A0A6B8KGB5_9HYPH|nr:glycosyltransferase family 39 protein [Methylocystis heyeri]QGM46672.1 hypothetical protein H2LOC_013755 [Methylocystis heyeri]